MTGDERVRHCGDCQTSVYNLSDLTREQAAALITEHAGDLCVRFYQRADGTILTRDCAVGARRRRRRRVIAGAAAVLAGGAAFAARLVHDDTEATLPDVVIGRDEPTEITEQATNFDEAPPAPMQTIKMGRYSR
jgi:hypothetical protein